MLSWNVHFVLKYAFLSRNLHFLSWNVHFCLEICAFLSWNVHFLSSNVHFCLQMCIFVLKFVHFVIFHFVEDWCWRFWNILTRQMLCLSGCEHQWQTAQFSISIFTYFSLFFFLWTPVTKHEWQTPVTKTPVTKHEWQTAQFLWQFLHLWNSWVFLT